MQTLTADRILSRRDVAEDIVKFAQTAVQVKQLNDGRFDAAHLLNLDEVGLFQKKHAPATHALQVGDHKRVKGEKKILESERRVTKGMKTSR